MSLFAFRRMAAKSTMASLCALLCLHGWCKSGLAIPRQALYNGNEVFVLEDTLLKVKHVTINRLLEDEAIVTGLEPNARLGGGAAGGCLQQHDGL